MAFPWIFESNFEQGDNSEWDSETDTASQLDFPSYKELARSPHRSSAPYSGAYCMRVQLTGGTASAIVTEGDIDIAAAANRFFKFNLWFSPDFTATVDDTFSLFLLYTTGSLNEVLFGARVVAATNVIQLGIGETSVSSFGAEAIERGVWYTVELDVTIDSGVGDDGTIDLYVTREDKPAATATFCAQVGSLNQGAIVEGSLGVVAQEATTTGTILFDNFVMDDARIYPKKDRFSETVLITKSGHAFVGPGTLENVTLLSGAGTDCVLSVFDTDSADTNDASNVVIELKNTANNEVVDPAGAPVRLRRGCYIQLSGTNPRALVKICKVDAFGSAAAIRRVSGVHR